MSAQPLVSIIVVTVNTPELTHACLESITRNSSVPYELIIVNNCTALRIRRILKTFPVTRLIQNKENLGFAKAANQGALAARGEYLCYLNTDTQVPPGWLERLLEGIRRPGVGAVGPLSQENYGNAIHWPPANLPANEQTKKEEIQR